MKLADLDINQFYTYADYLKWQFQERVELLKGKIFAMAAPNLRHQALADELLVLLKLHLRDKPCRVYSAPVDVVLTLISKGARETVVQPDVCVVCDLSKLTMKGYINGAPDIVVEVLSPGNNTKELRNKYDIYEEAGVLEYWIVTPDENYITVNKLVDGCFVPSRALIAGDTLTTPILPGFSIDIQNYFDREY